MPIINKGGCNLSFAGLKTAVLKIAKKIKTQKEKYDLAASFQFTIEEIIPSAGQGIIAIQCRKEDSKIQKLLKKINHNKTQTAAIAERQVLKSLEGDCDTAVGVISKINNNKIHVTAELFSIDGKDRYFVKSFSKIKNAKILGNQIGEILKKKSKNSYKN